MKKLVTTILVILVAVAAFILGYYEQTKLNECESEKKETKETTKEVSYEVGQELVDKISNVYSVRYYKYFKEGLDKIDNDSLIQNAIFANRDLNKDLDETEVTEKQVKAYVTEYFGEDYKYENKDVICPVDKNPFFEYKDGKYVYAKEAQHGHGGGSDTQRDTRVYIESVEYSGKDIVVEARIAYSGICGDTCGPLNAYYNYAKEVVYGNTSNDYSVTLTDNELKQIKDKLETTTFTFKANKDGSYYLSNVTVK